MQEQPILKKKTVDDFLRELEQACKWLNIDRGRARDYVRLLEEFDRGTAAWNMFWPITRPTTSWSYSNYGKGHWSIPRPEGQTGAILQEGPDNDG